MPEISANQECSYCNSPAGAWPVRQPIRSCSCCKQPLIALGPRAQRFFDRTNLPIASVGLWLLTGPTVLALVLHAAGAIRAGEQIIAYVLLGAAALWGWQVLANLRSGISRVFGKVYRNGPDRLIAPTLHAALAGCLMLTALAIDSAPAAAPDVTTKMSDGSLSPSRG